MKKLIALFLAALMAFSTAACGQNAPGASTPTASTDPTTATDPTTGSTTDSTTDTEETLIDLVELCKIKTYTGTDEDVIASRDNIVATFGSATLANSTLQMYYWMDIGDFLSNFDATSYGLDITQPLDAQSLNSESWIENGTWQHYFLYGALTSWNYYQALALAAQEEQISLTPYFQKQLDNLYDELTQSAVDTGFSSIDAMIQADVGPGCTAEDYYRYQEILYAAQSYCYAKLNSITFSDEEIEAYFTENEAALAFSGITKSTGDSYAVRHILVQIGEDTSEDAWEACRQEAQGILDQWLAGDATENSFAELAMEYSEDPGSCNSGGIYRGLTSSTSFLQEFKDWYLDESRQVGDYGLVKTSVGYHVMYYSGMEPIWYYYCREMMVSDELAEYETAAKEKYEFVINFDNILIGEVSLVETE